MDMTAPNVNDIEWGKTLDIEANATYVFDRGYYDYNWWYSINSKKIDFCYTIQTQCRLGSHIDY